MSTNGKGDKRRPSKAGAYARGYDAIDWSKGRKPTPPRRENATPWEGTMWEGYLSGESTLAQIRELVAIAKN